MSIHNQLLKCLFLLGLLGGLSLGFGLLHVSAAPLPERDEDKVTEYVKRLKSKNALVRKEAATVLGEMGPKAKNALPALRAILLDPDESVRGAVINALEKIDPQGEKETAKALEDLFKAKFDEVRRLQKETGERLKQTNAELKELAEKIKGELKQKKDNVADLQEKAERLKAEMETLQKSIRDRQAKIEDLQKKAEAAQRLAEEAKNRAEAYRKKAEELTKALEELEKSNPPKEKAAKENRPKEDVEGVVKSVDATSGLVTLNIGENVGLQKGHTLQVYRLEPKPEYLGTLRILEVKPKEAVARVVLTKRFASIKAGDKVASEISPK